MAVTSPAPGAGRRRRPAVLAWGLWAPAILGVAPVPWLDDLLREAGRPDLAINLVDLAFYLMGVGAATVGALLASRRPAHPVGWLLLVFGLATTVSGTIGGYAAYLLATHPEDPTAAGAAALVADFCFYPGPVALSFVLLLTPTGSLPSPRWRWLAVAIVAAPVAKALADTFGSYPVLSAPAPPLYSPLAVPALAGLLRLIKGVTSAGIGLAGLAAAGSLVVRFRRAHGTERQQLRWLALVVTTVWPAATLAATAANLLGHPGVAPWAATMAILGMQLAIYAAIVRYRLYDLDRIISRTLAYGLLTVLLGGGYAAVVLGLGQLLGRDSSLIVAGATLAVFGLSQPARRRIQAAVDRRFNRRHYDASRTIQAFSERLRQQVDLETVTAELQTVAEETMQPTSVSLWLRPHGESGTARSALVMPHH